MRLSTIIRRIDDHFEIQSKGTVHTLTIRKVDWNEGGEYKCVADGGAKTSATLVVKGNSSTRTIFAQMDLFFLLTCFSYTCDVYKTT